VKYLLNKLIKFNEWYDNLEYGTRFLFFLCVVGIPLSVASDHTIDQVYRLCILIPILSWTMFRVVMSMIYSMKRMREDDAS
jgi:hypothetical protein